MAVNWLSYIIVIIFTIIVTSILTESALVKRITYSPGVIYSAGKCRLAPGYGPLGSQSQSQEPVAN